MNDPSFKNACRVHTARTIARYLMSNADGRWDGAEKAVRHRELCSFYLAAKYGISDPEFALQTHIEEYQLLHEYTQELTDNLDVEIGFPVKGRPDYDRLESLFFERFHALAIEFLSTSSNGERGDSGSR